jgi:hypothetical protein
VTISLDPRPWRLKVDPEKRYEDLQSIRAVEYLIDWAPREGHEQDRAKYPGQARMNVRPEEGA